MSKRTLITMGLLGVARTLPIQAQNQTAEALNFSAGGRPIGSAKSHCQ